MIIKLKNLNKTFVKKDETIEVLKKFSYEFAAGKMYGICGHSGSGKSTLLTILGLMQAYDEGTYLLKDKDVSQMSNNEKSDIRSKTIGFIFQNFYLDEQLTAIENVMLPMIINKDIKKEDRYDKAIKLLKDVGLEKRINHFPKELSGGESQRVAIARALANDPSIILADEPTGDLDRNNEKQIFGILKKLSQEGKCVIVVSHSDEIKEYADKIIELDQETGVSK